MNEIRHCLALILLGVFAAALGKAETVGKVVQTDGEVCGWTRDVGPNCEFELREHSSIDRGMTVRTEDRGPEEERFLACVMTIDQWAADGGGAVIMQSGTMIRISHQVLSNFDVEMEQLAGVIQIVLPERDRGFGVKSGKAFIVLRGTYVEIRYDEATDQTTVGVVEGSVSVEGLLVPGAPLPSTLPDRPPEGAMSSHVYAGEQVTVMADGFISPPTPFPPDGPGIDSTILIEEEGNSTGDGMTVGPIREQICDLPRGVCG